MNVFALYACTCSDGVPVHTDPPAYMRVGNTPSSMRGFSSLVNAVSTAGLVTALRGGGTTGLTVFAPTNAAFAVIRGGAPTNVTTLGNVLRLHVVGARALSPSLSNNQTLGSLLGPSLTVGISGTTITVLLS